MKLLSNSEMKTYRRCKRQWYLSTYRRLQPARDPEAGTPLSIGNLVHDSLAAWYSEEHLDPIAFATAAIEADLAANPEQSAEILKEKALVVIMLEGYMEWLAETGVDSDLTVLGSEKMAEAHLVDGVKLISKLDAPVLRERDGARLVLEHKTVQSLKDPLPMLQLDTQFLTEHLVRYLCLMEEGASSEEAQQACQGVLWNGMRKVKRTAAAKPPFYAREDVVHNVEQLRSHWRHCVAIANEMAITKASLDQGVSHHAACPPNPMKDCAWSCDFFKVCLMADDGSDFEGALTQLYVEGDPLKRYLNADMLEDSIGG
jgi:hypothetical protein